MRNREDTCQDPHFGLWEKTTNLRGLEAQHALTRLILVKLRRAIKPRGKVEVVGCLGDKGTWKRFKSGGGVRDWDRLEHTDTLKR